MGKNSLEVRVSAIDFAGYDEGGDMIVSLVTDQPLDFVLRLRPEVVSRLETILEEVRERLKARFGLQ